MNFIFLTHLNSKLLVSLEMGDNMDKNIEIATISVINMACGHCRLKIESSLNEFGFIGSKFDMTKGTIKIHLDGSSIHKAYKAIENVGYTIDKDFGKNIDIIKVKLNTTSMDDYLVIEKVLKENIITDFTFDYEEDYLLVESNGMSEDDLLIILENNNIVFNS